MSGNRNHWVFKKKDIFLGLSIFVFVLYVFTMDLTSKVFPYSDYSVPLAFCIAIVILFIYLRKGVKRDRADILILLILLFMFINNQNLKNDQTYQIIFSVAFFVFYLIAKQTDNWHKYLFPLVLAAGLFYAVMTFLCMMSPAFFQGQVLPLFYSIGYGEQMLQLYLQGYQSGFTAHYSTNAIYLTSSLSVPIANILCHKRKKQVMYVIIAAILIVALLLTGKRAHFIFGIAAFLLTYYYVNSGKPLNKMFKILLILSVGSVIFLVAAAFFPALANFINRFIESAQNGDITSGRAVQRAYAMYLFSKAPVRGIGWDGFKYIYINMFGMNLNVHCVYVQLLCEVGVFGALVFYCFFGVSLYRVIKSVKGILKYENDNKEKMKYLSFALFYQFFFLMYCVTGNPLYDACTLFLYLTSCAIGSYYYIVLKKKYGGL